MYVFCADDKFFCVTFFGITHYARCTACIVSKSRYRRSAFGMNKKKW